MKKILSFITTMNLMMVGAVSVVSCTNPRSVNLPENKVINLSTIKTFDIDINYGESESEILRKVLTNNQFRYVRYNDIKIKDDSLKIPQSGNGEIIIESNGNNEKIIGTSPIIYLNVFPKKKDLANLQLQTSIGETKGYTPDVVLTQFIKVNETKLGINPGLIIKEEDLVITKPNEINVPGKGESTIRANSDSKFYFGYIKINFTIIAKKDLATLELKTFLADVGNNGEYEVCQKLYMKNTDKLENYIDFGYEDGDIPGKSEAYVSAKKNHLYGGKVKVTFHCSKCH